MLFLTTTASGKTTRSSQDDLLQLVEAVQALGEREGWPEDLSFRVSLVIDELAENVVNYAYEDGAGDVEVSVTSEDEAVVIEIVDEGRPFDPLTEAPEPDLTSALEDRPIGGLGVHFTKTLMDEIEYRRESGTNRLRIVAKVR